MSSLKFDLLNCANLCHLTVDGAWLPEPLIWVFDLDPLPGLVYSRHIAREDSTLLTRIPIKNAVVTFCFVFLFFSIFIILLERKSKKTSSCNLLYMLDSHVPLLALSSQPKYYQVKANKNIFVNWREWFI